jgi:hypothetical protein
MREEIMSPRNRWLRLVAAAALLLGTGGVAAAARVRYHYVPTDDCGHTTLKPDSACGGMGEEVRWFGLKREPCSSPPHPTHLITFCHPCSGRNVIVPVALPEGTPRIEHVRDRIVYNYGSYTVEARFLPDGSVDIIYNSGLLRAP